MLDGKLLVAVIKSRDEVLISLRPIRGLFHPLPICGLARTIFRLLSAQNSPKFRENSIGQLGVRVFTRSATIVTLACLKVGYARDLLLHLAQLIA